MYLFFKFIWKEERDSERQREIFHHLIHSPSSPNSCNWARLKPGAINSIWISHMSVKKFSNLEHQLLLLKHIKRDRQKVQHSQDTNQHFNLRLAIKDGQIFTYSNPQNSPPISFFIPHRDVKQWIGNCVAEPRSTPLCLWRHSVLSAEWICMAGWANHQGCTYFLMLLMCGAGGPGERLTHLSHHTTKGNICAHLLKTCARRVFFLYIRLPHSPKGFFLLLLTST